MRVCLISSNLHAVPSPSYGAVEFQMMAHATGLAEAGLDVHVITVADGDAPEGASGVTFHRIGEAFETGAARSVRSLLASQVRFGTRARRLIEELQPDVAHWHARYPCLIGLRGSKPPWGTIYHAHNWKAAEDMRYPAWSTRRLAATVGAAIDRRIARRCDLVLAVSEFLRGKIVESAGVGDERVRAVTNVVDAERFRPRPDLHPRAGRILFVGRVAAEKGLLTLIEAMPTVLVRVPEAQLAIVGPHRDGTERGGYRTRCEELVAKLGLSERVRFEGPVPNDELPERLAESRLLAVPSVWGEPCGVVVLEGLACGIPVLGSRVGGIPELIRDGVTGQLCEPGDPDSWAKALTRALRDDGLRESSRIHGPESIAAAHTWPRVRERLLDAYAVVASSAKARRKRS